MKSRELLTFFSEKKNHIKNEFMIELIVFGKPVSKTENKLNVEKNHRKKSDAVVFVGIRNVVRFNS